MPDNDGIFSKCRRWVVAMPGQPGCNWLSEREIFVRRRAAASGLAAGDANTEAAAYAYATTGGKRGGGERGGHYDAAGHMCRRIRRRADRLARSLR